MARTRKFRPLEKKIKKVGKKVKKPNKKSLLESHDND